MTSTTSKQTKKQLEEMVATLQSELEQQKRLADERLSQLKYLQADFDNYRKQFEKEKEQIIQLANEHLITQLLVVVDDVERALHTLPKSGSEKTTEGLAMVYHNFLKILENHGVKKIDTVGRKFDPHFHEVVAKEQSDQEEGTIIEELQAGFMLKSKVIRPSKVTVADHAAQEGE